MAEYHVFTLQAMLLVQQWRRLETLGGTRGVSSPAPTAVCTLPDVCRVEYSFISRIGEACHPCELFESQLFSPRPYTNFGLVKLVVPGKHRRAQRRRHPACPPALKGRKRSRALSCPEARRRLQNSHRFRKNTGAESEGEEARRAVERQVNRSGCAAKQRMQVNRNVGRIGTSRTFFSRSRGAEHRTKPNTIQGRTPYKYTVSCGFDSSWTHAGFN